MDAGLKLISDIKFYNDYSKYIDEEQRKEKWTDSVDRVMSMHENNPKFTEAFKNPVFKEYFDFAKQAYYESLVLASQRTLQFGGAPILKHNSKLYNCLTSYIDRVSFFQECMFWLLSGCGVGFSVQTKHISKLPNIAKRTKGTKTFVVQDSIEGWSDAFGVQVSSYVSKDRATFPQYSGYIVHYDLSLVRPEGAYISGGFKAPGPEPLRKALIKTEQLLEKAISETGLITSIVAYDYVMHMSDAVLAGGVRRCLPGSYSIQLDTGEWINIKDVKPNVHNINYLDKSYKILNLFDQGLQETIKIYTADGYHESTLNHKWLVYDFKTKTANFKTTFEIEANPTQYAFLKDKSSSKCL